MKLTNVHVGLGLAAVAAAGAGVWYWQKNKKVYAKGEMAPSPKASGDSSPKVLEPGKKYALVMCLSKPVSSIGLHKALSDKGLAVMHLEAGMPSIGAWGMLSDLEQRVAQAKRQAQALQAQAAKNPKARSALRAALQKHQGLASQLKEMRAAASMPKAIDPKLAVRRKAASPGLLSAMAPMNRGPLSPGVKMTLPGRIPSPLAPKVPVSPESPSSASPGGGGGGGGGGGSAPSEGESNSDYGTDEPFPEGAEGAEMAIGPTDTSPDIEEASGVMEEAPSMDQPADESEPSNEDVVSGITSSPVRWRMIVRPSRRMSLANSPGCVWERVEEV